MLVSAFSRVLPFLFIGLLVWPFTASAATLDDIVEEFPIVGASIDDIEESAHPDAEISGSVTGAVVVDGAAAQNPVPETDMWRVADVPESIVTPGAVDQWNVYRWGDVRVRIRLRGVDGGGYAADQDGGATLITDPGAGLEHAVYVANEGMVEEFLVLDSDAAGNETGRTFVWDVEGLPSDWSMKETAPGSVVLFDEGEGERRMEITAPVVQDEVGRRLLSNFGLDPASQTLRLTIDTSLAQGSVVADPVFFLNGSGELQQNFCRGGISDCSVVDNNAPPNFFQGNVNDGWFFYGSTYATGPAVIAVGAPPAGYTGAAIYQPGSYLGLKSFNVYGGTVRTGYQNFECTIHARKGGAYWAEIANSAVTVDGPVSSQVYYRSFPFTAHPVNPTTQYLDMAAVVLRARTGVHGGSNNGCTLDQNGIIYATLADSSGPQQNTGGAPDAGTNGATFSQSTWYGPANPMPQFLARFTDQGSGIGTLQPIITTKNGSAAEINALYTNNLPHPSFVFCRGFNVGASNTDVRPCWLQPTMPIGVGLPPATMLETSSTKHNYFQWKVWDFSANYSFGTKVEVKWDKTIPVKPATVSDGSGLDVDAAPPTNPMAFTWSVGTDATAGVGGYRYCVDQSQDIVTNAQYGGQWCASSFVETTTGPMTSPSASATLPSLAHGAAYSICVRTIDRANNQSGGRCSDGFFINAQPPATPSSLIDGPGGSDIAAIADDGGVSAAFAAVSPTSVARVQGCVVVLAQSASNCGSGAVVTWQTVEPDSDYASVAFAANLTAGQSYRTCIRFQGFNGIYGTAACTNGFVVDTANPFGAAGVHDGAGATDVDRIAPNAAIAIGFNAPVDQGGSVVTDAIVCWYPAGDTDQCDSSEAVEQQSAAGPGSTSVTLEDPAALVRGRTYIACVSFMDAAQNEGARGCSNGFAITGASLQSAWSETGQVQASTSTLQGHFAYVDGPAVDMVEQCVTTGTTPAACTSWTPTGLEGAFEVDGLTLTDAATYRYCYRLLDESEAVLESGCSPDPVTVDATAPTAATAVQDGDVPGTDSNLSIASTTVGATWTAATDTGGSGIAGYETCVVESTATCGADDWTEDPQPGTSATSFVEDVYGDVMKVCVRAVDYAGNASVSACSNGQVVDASEAEIAHHAQQRELVGLPSSEAAVEAALADPDSVPVYGSVASEAEADAVNEKYDDLAEARDALDASSASTTGIVDIQSTSGANPITIAYTTSSPSSVEAALETGMSADAKARLQVVATPSSRAQLDAALDTVERMKPTFAEDGVAILGTTIDGPTGKVTVQLDSPVPGGGHVAGGGDPEEQADGLSGDDADLVLDSGVTEVTATAGRVDSEKPDKMNFIRKKKRLFGGAVLTFDQDGERNIRRCTSNAAIDSGSKRYLITAYHCWRAAVDSESDRVTIAGGKQVYLDNMTTHKHYTRYPLTNRVSPFKVSKSNDIALFKMKDPGNADYGVFNYSYWSDAGHPDVYTHVSVIGGGSKITPIARGDVLCQSGMNVPYTMNKPYGLVCGAVRKKTFIRYGGLTDRNGSLIPFTAKPAWAVDMGGCSGDSGGAVYTEHGARLVGIMSGIAPFWAEPIALPSGHSETDLVRVGAHPQLAMTDIDGIPQGPLCVKRWWNDNGVFRYQGLRGLSYVTELTSGLQATVGGDYELVHG